MLFQRSSVVAPFLRGQERPTRWEWICSYSIHGQQLGLVSLSYSSSNCFLQSPTLNSLQALKFIHPSPFASPFLRSSLKLPPHLLQFSQSSLDISLIKTTFNDDAQTTPL
ncbi:unnamed protein product [Brassica rapa subsp. trilocularis]|uniref:(rape) hypothetical protein n=1 Tax=Brassica napus TaxID=3708 RepID=A0A816WZM9_BRANA|nr:unnamed protein product [Brassica napus]